MTPVTLSPSLLEVTPRKERESSPLSLADFLKALREVGAAPIPLTVRENNSDVDWRTRRPIYKVIWRRQRRIRLFGLLTISWASRGSGRFVKFGPEEVALPLEAAILNAAIQTRPEVEETAVFVETQRDPILAVRVEGQWLGLYRWLNPIERTGAIRPGIQERG